VGSVIALRWVLYFDLSLLFGLPLFLLYAVGDDRHYDRHALTGLALLAATGLAMSALAFVFQAAVMTGVPVRQFGDVPFGVLLRQTAFGTALVVRGAALLAVLFCATFYSRARRTTIWGAMLAGAVALATLAWSGHGAAGEGAAGWVQLIADILHLLAAAAWLAAIAAFLFILFGTVSGSPGGLSLARHALAKFSIIGTVLVGVLIVTGFANAMFLVGFAQMITLGGSLYGRLLLAKLILFGGMVALASLNRYRLVPSLVCAEGQETERAIGHLRKSLLLEGGLALLILALVAWLGTLSPPILRG